jgi:hypothetical protein
MSRDVHSCTHWQRLCNSAPPPAFGLVLRGRYWSKKRDDISSPAIIDVGLLGNLVEPDGALNGGAGEGGEVQGGGVHQVETEPRRLPDHHN